MPRPDQIAGPGATPRRIGKYRILRRIAGGGMADVFLAQAGSGPPVAIKRLKPQLAHEPDRIELFFDEAILGTQLRHPNIVRVIEVGEEAGELYMVLELLHGETVHAVGRAARRQRRRVPPGFALHMALGVANGLHYAHERNCDDGSPLAVVHRDVSPQNIVCTYDGDVKLIDFGIARSAQRATETQDGIVRGKVAYMSPEQCLGLPLDRRADVFSLGVVLYELTLGVKLYEGRSDFDVMRAIVDGEVAPPSQLDPTYDPRLEVVVRRALEKNRARRYQTARELGDALSDVIHEMDVRLERTDMQNFFCEFFGDRVDAWHTARDSGISLAEHLRTADLDEPSITEDQLDSSRYQPTNLELPATRAGGSDSLPRVTPMTEEATGKVARLGVTGSGPRDPRDDRTRPSVRAVVSLRTITVPAAVPTTPAHVPAVTRNQVVWLVLALQLPLALVFFVLGLLIREALR